MRKEVLLILTIGMLSSCTNTLHAEPFWKLIWKEPPPQEDIHLLRHSRGGASHADWSMQYKRWNGKWEYAWIDKHINVFYRSEHKNLKHSHLEQNGLEYKAWDDRNWTAKVQPDGSFKHCLNGKGPCHTDFGLGYISWGGANWIVRIEDAPF